ncbi:MAG: aldo/keto reductase [Dehalococcoidia bacterium]
MKYRKLGSTGLEISEVGLGTNNFGGRLDYQSSDMVISQALDEGINFIDTSNSYGNSFSEEYIGRSLEGRRNQAIVATKVSSKMGEGPNQSGNSRQHIMEQVDKSLLRLRSDHIDLYQIHWWDSTTPIEETLLTLNDLTVMGKIRYFGCSNFNAWQVCESLWTSKIRNINSFISVQPHYSILERKIEDELLPFTEKYNIGVLPYFPLANGFLTGKYRKGNPFPTGTRLDQSNTKIFTDKNFELLEKLINFAEDRGRSVLDLAFAWLLFRENVSSVIAGATTADQVKSNAKTSGWKLSCEEYETINSLIG